MRPSTSSGNNLDRDPDKRSAYKIFLARKAAKDLKSLGTIYQPRVLKVIEELASNPMMGVKLKGQLEGLYKVKIPPIRVIYKLDVPNKIVLIVTIGHRQGFYK